MQFGIFRRSYFGERGSFVLLVLYDRENDNVFKNKTLSYCLFSFCPLPFSVNANEIIIVAFLLPFCVFCGVTISTYTKINGSISVQFVNCPRRKENFNLWSIVNKGHCQVPES